MTVKTTYAISRRNAPMDWSWMVDEYQARYGRDPNAGWGDMKQRKEFTVFRVVKEIAYELRIRYDIHLVKLIRTKVEKPK